MNMYQPYILELNNKKNQLLYVQNNTNIYNNDKLHYQKNFNYNLVTLCSSCHDDVDRNKIIINGWLDTNEGKKLDFKYNKTITIEYINNIWLKLKKKLIY